MSLPEVVDTQKRVWAYNGREYIHREDALRARAGDSLMRHFYHEEFDVDAMIDDLETVAACLDYWREKGLVKS